MNEIDYSSVIWIPLSARQVENGIYQSNNKIQ